jgi:hypothetical protein
MQALYEINVSEMLGSDEYKGMFEDMARFIFIQFMIQAMLVMMAPDQYKLFAPDFLMLLIFVTLGVMFYWLVFKKLVNII